MLSTLCHQQFVPLLNKKGTLTTSAGHSVPVQVEQVTDNARAMPKKCAPGRRIPFSVVLTAPLVGFPELDGLCTLELEGLDTIKELFVTRIVPHVEQDGNAWCQVVFN